MSTDTEDTAPRGPVMTATRPPLIFDPDLGDWVECPDCETIGVLRPGEPDPLIRLDGSARGTGCERCDSCGAVAVAQCLCAQCFAVWRGGDKLDNVEQVYRPLKARSRYCQSLIAEGAAPQIAGDRCIPWAGPLDRDGYGLIGKERATHTVLLAAGFKRCPECEAAHSCHNRDCINVRHLSYVSHGENMADMPEDHRSNGPSLTCREVTEIRRMSQQENMTITAIANKTRRTRQAVRAAVMGPPCTDPEDHETPGARETPNIND